MIILKFIAIFAFSIIVGLLAGFIITALIVGFFQLILGDDDEGVETINAIVAVAIFSSVSIWTAMSLMGFLMDYYNVSFG